MTAVTSRPAPVATTTAPRRASSEWVDRFVGSDPGLNRFRMALQSVLTIGLILLVEWIFVRNTHALQIQTHGAVLPAAKAAGVAAANHQFLVIGMLLGALVGMISAFGVMDPTAKGQLATMLFIPIPMIAAMTVGIGLGGHRVLALISLVVALTIGTYFRRFGPRGFIAGMLLFMGDFFGFFLHGAVHLSDMGWLVSEMGVGLLVAMVVRFTFFYPRPAKALARTQRSYTARARKVAALALALFDDPEHSERQARRLRSQLVRLNEAALMIDAQLGDPSAVADGSSGQLLHQRLFDVELALTNLARFARAMARFELPPAQREQVRLALASIVGNDAESAKAHATELVRLLQQAGTDAGALPTGEDRAAVVIPHRFAASVIDLAEAVTEWTALGIAADGQKGTFQPSVMLFGGWLPGSAQVSAMASLEKGRRRWERITLAPYTRTAIQMGCAVGGAVALGDLVSGRRFYWAVIAAFITFMGANNSGEQARKAIFRVAGTLVGIGVGSLVVRIVGHHTDWSIAVILVSLFFGFYLMRINYAFMVIGITVMVSQLYVQLDEFSHHLLWLRLEETAIGAAVAVAVVMLVVPLRTRRVLRIALRSHVQAVATLVDHTADRLLDDERGPDSTLRADARGVDASFQAVVATIAPLRRNLAGQIDEKIVRAAQLAAASRNYSRNLVADVESVGRLEADTRLDVRQGSETLRQSLDVVAAALNGPRDGVYTRSSSLFDRAERRLENSSGGVDDALFALRDLTLVDQTMASLAETLRLTVTDHDTARVGGGPAGRNGSGRTSSGAVGAAGGTTATAVRECPA